MTDAPIDLDTAWRWFYVVGGAYLASPYHSGALDPVDLDAEAVCSFHDHPAPAPGCECGLYCAPSAASLLTIAMQLRNWPEVEPVVMAAIDAEERGVPYRLPTPVLARVRAEGTLAQGPRSILRRSLVIWATAGRHDRGNVGAYMPELGELRRARRLTLRELHVGEHDLTPDEIAALEDRYGVPLTQHTTPATEGPKKLRLRIGGRQVRIPGVPEKPLSDYALARKFTADDDPILADLARFPDLIPG